MNSARPIPRVAPRTARARPGKSTSSPASPLWIKQLESPNAYLHEPKLVKKIETHASTLFLAPPFVLKTKKNVRLGFLDYSSLEKRLHACHREFTLNQALTQDVYLAVVPITQTPSGVQIGASASGPVLEFGILMRFLDPEGFLDARLSRGQLTRSHIDLVARRLASYYHSVHSSRATSQWGRLDRLKISTDENFRQTRPHLGSWISNAAWSAIREFTQSFYTHHALDFESRRRAGWIRPCHGDLRLEHIHLAHSAINIYDCIEFNDRFRLIDVANDIAFLAMDLDFHHAPALAQRLVDQCSQALRDPHLSRWVDFYKTYRAFVRGKVECLQSSIASENKPAHQRHLTRAADYFQLALQYAVTGSTPTALVIMGRPGVGKSCVATALQNELRWQVFSSDCIRKKLAGIPLHQRTRPQDRRRTYSPAMTRRTYSALTSAALHTAQRSKSVILDATFGSRTQRDTFRRQLQKRNVRVIWVEIHAPDSTVKHRLQQRATQADVVSDARLEDFDKLSTAFQPTQPDEPDVLRIQSGRPPQVLAGQILLKLAKLQALRPFPSTTALPAARRA